MSTWESLSCGNCFGEAAPSPNLSSLSPSNNSRLPSTVRRKRAPSVLMAHCSLAHPQRTRPYSLSHIRGCVPPFVGRVHSMGGRAHLCLGACLPGKACLVLVGAWLEGYASRCSDVISSAPSGSSGRFFSEGGVLPVACYRLWKLWRRKRSTRRIVLNWSPLRPTTKKRKILTSSLRFQSQLSPGI